MIRTPWHVCLVLCVYWNSIGAVLGQEIKPDVIAKCKRATALIISSDRKVSGSAFCIDKSGYFVTNSHVLKGIEGRASVVLSPGEANEKSYEAELIVTSAELDLAIIGITGASDLEELPLAEQDNAYETMQVIVLGYPFGQSLAVTEKSYPNVSVNVARISSLRKVAGRVEALQFDSQVNPGNSGGPVVSSDGTLFGITQATVQGAGINFAIPVSKLRSLLKDVTFNIHSIDSTLPARTELVFSVASFAASRCKDPHVKVVTTSLDREVEAEITEERENVYRAIVRSPHLPMVSGPTVVTLEFDDGSSVYGELQNVKDKIGDTPLTEIASLHRDGDKLELRALSGTVAVIEDLPDLHFKIAAGKRVLDLPLSNLQSLTARIVDLPRFTAKYEILLLDGEKPVASRVGRFGEGGLQPLRTLTDGHILYDRSMVAGGKKVRRSHSIKMSSVTPFHSVLFADAPQNVVLMGSSNLTIVELSTRKVIRNEQHRDGYSRMSLAPDGNTLYFVGGKPSKLGAREPPTWQILYRLNLRKNELESTTFPLTLYGIAAISNEQFALTTNNEQGLLCTLNRWPPGGNVQELHRELSFAFANPLYDPFRSRLLLTQVTTKHIGLIRPFGVSNSRLVPAENSQTFHDVNGFCSLGADGRSLYVGQIQVDASDVRQELDRLDDPVLAATADLAITAKGVVKLETGELIESIPSGVNAVSIAHSGRAFAAYSQSNQYLYVYDILP